MEPLSNDSAPTFFVLHSLRRYWRAIALTVIVIVALAGGYELAASRSYTSSATVLVRPLVGNAFTTDTSTTNQNANVALQTEARIAASSAVATQVDKALPASTSCSSTSIRTSVLTNTQLIELSFVGSSRSNAKTCAENYAERYLAYRTNLAVTTLQAQLGKLNQQVNAATVSLIGASKDAKSNPSDTASAAKVQLLTSRLSALQTTAGQLEAQSTEPGNVVVQAATPRKANGISPILIVLAAGIVALILGMLVAIWRGRSDRRIHAVTDGTILDLPVLNSVLSSRDAAGADGMPEGNADEEFRLAAIGLLARATPHSTIAVAPVTVEGSSAAATIRLARAVAASGYSVILVDATTRGPQVGTMLGVEQQLGLSDILGGADSEAIMLVETGGVEVLTAGTDPAGNRQRYSGALLREFLGELKQAVDFVLVSTSPVGTADGLGVLLTADQWVVVARAEDTTYEDIVETKSLAGRLGATILGVVFAQGSDTPQRASKVPGAPSQTKRPADTKRPAGERVGRGRPVSDNPGGTAKAPAEPLPPSAKAAAQKAARSGPAAGAGDRPATDAGRPRRGTR